MVEQLFQPLGRGEVSGILPRGGTIIGTSRTNPYKVDGGVDAVLAHRSSSSTRSSRSAARTPWASLPGSTSEFELTGRRRPEDDRQRPLGHRLHLRLRHRRRDLHRGDRPAAHDRRVAQPRDGRRGDGPPRRLDRRPQRDRRRRRRDPDPRAPDRLRRGLRASSTGGTRRQELLDRRRQRGLRARRDAEDKGEVDQFGHELLAKRGVGDRLGEEIEAAPASRRGSRCSATSSAAAPRPRRPDPRHALRPEGRGPGRGRASSATWPRCTATTSSPSRSRRRRPSPRSCRTTGTMLRALSSARLSLGQRRRAVPPRRHDEVLTVRRRQDRVEALVAVARLERDRPVGSTRPSQAGCGEPGAEACGRQDRLGGGKHEQGRERDGRAAEQVLHRRRPVPRTSGSQIATRPTSAPARTIRPIGGSGTRAQSGFDRCRRAT